MLAVGVFVAGLAALVLTIQWRLYRKRLSQYDQQSTGRVADIERRMDESKQFAEQALRTAETTASQAVAIAEMARAIAHDVSAGADAAQASAKASERMAAAAESAARAAARSAEASSQTALAFQAVVEAGKRAWIHASELKLTLKTSGEESSVLETWVTNLGTTPAMDVRISSNFLLSEAVPEELELTPRVTLAAMGPGVNLPIKLFQRIAPAQLAAVTTGRKVLLACGQVDYKDVFGQARQSRWCSVYDHATRFFYPADRHNRTT